MEKVLIYTGRKWTWVKHQVVNCRYLWAVTGNRITEHRKNSLWLLFGDRNFSAAVMWRYRTTLKISLFFNDPNVVFSASLCHLSIQSIPQFGPPCNAHCWHKSFLLKLSEVIQTFHENKMCRAKLQQYYLGVKVTDPLLLRTWPDVDVPTHQTLASHEYSPTCWAAIYRQCDMNL